MTPNQEPVLINGTATAIAGALIPVLIALGVQADEAGRIGALIGALAVGILGLIALLHARAKVTPLARPRTAEGVPLVEAPRVAEITAAVDAAAVSSTDAGSPAPTTPGGSQ